MKIFLFPLLFFISSIAYSQSIITSGTIYEGEFTSDKKISGLFTYMNNSDQTLQLEIKRGDNQEIILSDEVASKRGKQVRVYKQEYSSTEQQVFGDYSISFYHKVNGVNGSLIFVYNNVSNYAPGLRVVSVIFAGLNEDEFGKYIDVKIDWQTIREGTQTDNRKFYISE